MITDDVSGGGTRRAEPGESQWRHFIVWKERNRYYSVSDNWFSLWHLWKTGWLLSDCHYGICERTGWLQIITMIFVKDQVGKE